MCLASKMSTFYLAFLFILFSAYIRGSFGAANCDPDEMECDDGFCISKIQWCDSVVDCRDTSDEKYCNGGKVPCRKDIHFECENKKCIPLSSRCDEYDDCHDGSDERNCSGSTMNFMPPLLAMSNGLSTFTPTHSASVDRAVDYLLKAGNSDYGWGAFTPRAVIALSMADRVLPISETNKQLMLKKLNIHILQDLMKNPNIALSNLALYINALYATCQDPRNFQGTDLVARLRLETDVAIQSNTSVPLAFLSLCLSNSTRNADYYVLANLYNSREDYVRAGSKALIILAMTCIMHKDNIGLFGNYISTFFSEEIVKVQNADIYTKALFKQASIAVGVSYPLDLANEQLPDGSFGDILSTYYAIPVLLNSSLLNMVCSNPSKELTVNLDTSEGRNEVTYSLWITLDKDPISHSIAVRFYGKKSIFDIMNMAATRDPLYRFLYEELEPEGKRVYSVAGIPNDAESGTSWSLYLGGADVKVNFKEGLVGLDIGVDKYFPLDQDHLIFWLRRTL